MHKRSIAALMAVIMASAVMPVFPVSAETDEPFPYTLFAGSNEDGALTIHADHICVNGSIAANGTITANSDHFNVNGQCIEQADFPMVYAFGKLRDAYFSSDDVITVDTDYTFEDVNIKLNVPVVSAGEISMNGNINLRTQLMAERDIHFSGNSCNADNAALISHSGNIVIESENFGYSGLIYAPNGNITIDADSLNLNNVVVIGQTITIDCPNLSVNYNSSVGDLIGTLSDDDPNPDPVNPDYFAAFGRYIEDTNTMMIYWNEREDAEAYDVQLAMNGAEAELLGTVTDELYYGYEVPADFETGEFTVSYINADGTLIKTPAVTLIRTEDGFALQYADTDGDGLTDPIEFQLGTDPEMADTDEDGLTDYEEAVILGTDPLDYDSCEEGTADSEADPDEDGLTNVDEIAQNTDAFKADTDEDGLTDGDEVHNILTNPLLVDTDGDTLSDGFEVRHGLDPLSPETDGIPDNERQIEQELDSDNQIFSAINTDDSPFDMSINTLTNGDAEQEFSISRSSYAVSYEIDAQIGKVMDLAYSDACSPESIRLSFSIKEAYRDNTLNKYSDQEDLQGIKRLCVFRLYDEIGMMLPLDTQYDVENNVVYVDVTEGGTYCVMDLEIWFDLFDLEPSEYAPMLANAAPRLRAPGAETRDDIPLDIVFILQTAGKEQSVYNQELTLMTGVCDEVFKQYSNARVYLIDYTSNAADAKIVKNGMRSYFTNVTAFSNAISAITYKYDTGYGDTNSAFTVLMNDLPLRRNINTYIYHLHNGNNVFRLSNDAITICNSGIGIFSQFMPNSSYKYDDSDYGERVKAAILAHNGLYSVFSNGAKQEILDHIGLHLNHDLDRTDYDALLSNSLRKITLDTVLNATNNTDTDLDSVTDWNEVMNEYITFDADGKIQLPTIQMLLSRIDLDGILGAAGSGAARDAMFRAIKNRKVLPCVTDPTSEDTDDDGYTDAADPDANHAPALLFEGKNDFLDKEIYYLKANAVTDEYRLDYSSSTLTASAFTGADTQKFQFLWTKNGGYKIASPDGSKVMTVVRSGSQYKVYMQADRNADEQRWEVLPYYDEDTNETGLVFRCRYIDRSTSSVGKSLYLNYENASGLTAVNTVNRYCKINLSDIASWTHFGKTYLHYIRWIDAENMDWGNVTRAMNNYQNNSKIGFANENIYRESTLSLDILLNQNQGNFPSLKLADAHMDGVACEVIGTYNGINMAKGTKYLNFFRLAVEFELSALQYNYAEIFDNDSDIAHFFRGWFDLSPDNVKEGGLGSDPHRLGACLDAYNVNYHKVNIYDFGSEWIDYLGNFFKVPLTPDEYNSAACQAYEDILKTGKCGVLSYKFNTANLHTYAQRYDSAAAAGNEVVSYNRYCSEPAPTKSQTVEDSITGDKSKPRLYYVGYVIL